MCVLPSMMEMCTALRRVLGTLVKRGPWVMDGQLLLGTMPALERKKKTILMHTWHIHQMHTSLLSNISARAILGLQAIFYIC